MANSRGGDYDDDISTPSLCHDILSQILSRSPVKSLMRFKCVCKQWRSLVEQDPHFIQLHLSRSKSRPSLLISRTWNDQDDVTCFFSAENLLEGGVAGYRLTTSWSSCRMLKPVNGLICFIHLNEDAVRIYNLSTREVTPWIKTSIDMVEEEEKHDGVEVYYQKSVYMAWYGFGFDPATKEHKVLCVWDIWIFKTFPAVGNTVPLGFYQVCEVLTVGHNTWRRIDDEGVLQDHQRGDSVYVNGSIYWLNITKRDMFQHPTRDAVVMAFDVGSEKFRRISIPKFVLNQFPRSVLPGAIEAELVEVDGCIALSHGTVTIKLWVFDDDDKAKRTSSSNWIDETFSMTFDQKREYLESFQAIPERGDLIMIKPRNPIDIFSIYYYDWKKKTSRRVEFTTNHHGQIPSNKRKYSYKITPFVESLLPVRQQRAQQHHHSQP